MIEINERAVRANHDVTEFEDMLMEYRPFIASCVYKTVGKHTDMHDDMMSIAMIAFEESVRRYNPKSGNFLAFSSHVIRCRLIDHMRSNQRKGQVISLDCFVKGDGKDSRRDKAEHAYLSQNLQSRFDDPVKIEIDALSEELGKYGLRFTDVEKSSPRAGKTKKASKKVAKLLAGDAALYTELQRTRQLPLRELEDISGVSRKTMARHRNYIVCLVEMLAGEYPYLAPYAKDDEEGDKQ